MQTKARVVLLLVFIGLIFPIEQLVVPPARAVPFGWDNPRYAPIVVSSNAEFTSDNGVSEGEGTASSPYVIERMDIVGVPLAACPYHGLHAAIQICNTDAYFIIRNVRVNSASGYGILLSNVTHGVVENALVFDNYLGISVRYSKNIGLIENTILNNRNGISVHRSSDISFHSNRGGDSLLVYWSSNVSIIQNDVSSLFFEGRNVTMRGNKASVDIAVYSSSPEGYSSFTIAPDNLIRGEPFYYYKDCKHLWVHGLVVGRLLVANCSNVVVTGVSARGVSSLGFVFVERGRISNSNATLFYLSRSSYLSIVNNLVAGGGMFCYDSNNVTIANNEGLNSSIYLADCSANLRHNGGFEIYVEDPSGP